MNWHTGIPIDWTLTPASTLVEGWWVPPTAPPIHHQWLPEPMFPFYIPPVQHGCICPPTSEKTCQGDNCPRQPTKPPVATC